MSPILIDRRIGSRDLVSLLPRGYAELTDLEFGDAVVIGNGPEGPVTEAFERKRLGDVLSCIQDGRFAAHQLIGLREFYEFTWIVIEDEIRKHPETGVLQRVTERKPILRRRGGKLVVVGEEIYWSDALYGAKRKTMWRDFQHWILSMSRIGGIDNWVFTRNAQETADLIWTVHTWRQKRWKQHKSLSVMNCSNKLAKTQLFRPPHVALIANTYTDVGYDTALSIAERYASPEDFAQATLKDLSEIVVTERKDKVKVRLGKVLAQSIVQQTKLRRNLKCRT